MLLLAFWLSVNVERNLVAVGMKLLRRMAVISHLKFKPAIS